MGTVISSKNVSLPVSTEGTGPRTEDKDEVFWLLFIPFGTPNVKEATDRAIERAGPQYDALVDGVVSSYFYYFVLFAISGIKVEGTPINTKTIAAYNPSLLEGKPVLYHSSLGISDDEAIAAIGVVDLGGSPQDSVRAIRDGLIKAPNQP